MPTATFRRPTVNLTVKELDNQVALALGWIWVEVPRPDSKDGKHMTGFYWAPYLMPDGSEDVSRELTLPDFTNLEWQGTLLAFLDAHRIRFSLLHENSWIAQTENEHRGVVRVQGGNIGEVLCRLIIELHRRKMLLTRKQRIANLYADIKARRSK